MATDFFIAFLFNPIGWLFIVAAIGLPFLAWRRILGDQFALIGKKPLALGYGAVLAALIIASFIGACDIYAGRVEKDNIPFTFWYVVPGWTLYLFAMFIFIALILISVVGVPLTALLIRINRFHYKIVIPLLALLIAGFTLMDWMNASNTWEEMHRAEAFLKTLKAVSLGTLCTAVPFLCGVFYGLRGQKKQKIDTRV